MLANPRTVWTWKREYDSVSAEAEDKNSRFAPGLPDKSDGQLLFTLHMLHKMDPKGSRVGILSNGSPLLTVVQVPAGAIFASTCLTMIY